MDKRLVLIIVIATIAGYAAYSSLASQKNNGLQNDPVSANVTIYADQRQIIVKSEVAATPETQARGLMFRESLSNGTGMIFIFEEPANHGFYMKNTLIPLDIIYIDKHYTIKKIRRDFQPCKIEPCEIDWPGEGILYALEVPAGWASAQGIEVGQKVAIEK